MHKTTFLLLCFVISLGASGQSQDRNDSPRIGPMPLKITYQTIQHRPVFQDAPPSTFVPPTSGGSGSFDPKGSFNPQGSFDPRGSSEKKPPSIRPNNKQETQGTGFSSVDPTKTTPLRSKTDSSVRIQPQSNMAPSNTPPSNTRSLSGSPKASFQLQGNSDSTRQSAPTSKGFSSSPSGAGSQASQQNINRQNTDGRATPRATMSPNARGIINPSTPASLSGQNPNARNFQNIAKAETPATIDTRKVDDASFDPQLKEISDLILASIQRPTTNRLSLAKAVSGARSSAHRKQIAKQYWTSFVNAADLQSAQQELQLLGTISSPSNQLDQLRLRAALSSARARMAEAKMAHKRSVESLYKLAPYFDLTKPISFADLPWIGKYKTNSESLARSGMFDQKIKNVDKALPAIRDLIYLRGAAVYDNLMAYRQSIDGLATGAVNMNTVLKLHEETRDQRIEFFKKVEKYNHAIADFAITVFPNASQPQVVANMLVDTQKTLPLGDTILDPNVRQASRNQPERR